MGILKRIFDFYINSSIHVALAVYALTWITLMEYNLGYDENCLYFNFFATISAYNFVKYFGLAKFHHRSLATWLRVIQVFSFISFLAMCYYLFRLESDAIVTISVLALITFFYAIPLVPKHYIFDEQKNLRQIGGLKIYVIALVWTVATVILPLINNDSRINTEMVLSSAQRFCFVIVLMLPFEIRDLNYDSLKLATIPQKIGVKRTKIIGALLLMLFVSLEFFKEIHSQSMMISTLVITFITLLFLVFSNKKQPRYYSTFWVESIPIFWLVILLVLG